MKRKIEIDTDLCCGFDALNVKEFDQKTKNKKTKCAKTVIYTQEQVDNLLKLEKTRLKQLYKRDYGS